jgi:hypothetical protein
MNCKGNTPIAVGILTFGIVVLMGFAWFVFTTKDDGVGIQVQSSGLLNGIYARESAVNYHIQRMIEKAIDNGGNSEGSFILEFNKQLDMYKEGKSYVVPELEFVEQQLDEGKVEIKDGKLYLDLKLKVEDRIVPSDNGRKIEIDIVSASYVYEKKFSAEIR